MTFKRTAIIRKPLAFPKAISGGRQSPVSGAVVAVPKANMLQHKGYMDIVRLMPCAHCGIEGYTQFCHSDETKGMAIKSDCRNGWPGCEPHNGDPGCHWRIGTSGTWTRAERRALEAEYAAKTRKTVLDNGLWPESLPKYEK